MDFRTFEENADAAAERRAAMDQKRKEMADRLKDKAAGYEKRDEPVKKGVKKPNQPTSMASDHRGTTHYSRDADED